jgi:NAD(P)-dependent dehydrogenase (short-subunit alcohol dehydrogenase family)
VRGDRVFAACRRPAGAGDLTALTTDGAARVQVVALDVGDASSIAGCAEAVAESTDRLDLLVNAAGVYSGRGSADPHTAGETLGRLEMAPALDVLRTNALGPLLVAQAFLPLLRRGASPRIVSLSSGYGSVSANTSGFPYYYAASKAALNMLMRSVAADTAGAGITTVLLDPGWVRTDMGGPRAPVSAPDSVSAMLAVIDALDPRRNGTFLDRHGRPQAW